jgi:hypothetical protein
MTVTINKANQTAIVQLGTPLGIAKSNLYVVLSPGISINKANLNAVLVEFDNPPFTRIGQVFPFTLGGGIWAVPFYTRIRKWRI